jgi:hypothetical protein
MFNTETIKKLAEVLKLDVSDFTTKLKSDKEETLEVPTLFTEDDKNVFGTNRFNEGKRAMSEITAKDLKTKHNIDIASKNLDDVIEAIAEKKLADAKIAPDEQVKKHKKDADELRTKLQQAENEKQELINNHENKLFTMNIDNEIITSIPDLSYTIPKKAISVLYKAEREFKKEDNRIVTYKEGRPLVDKVLNPISLKDDLAQFCETYVNKNGMGGGDNSGGGTAGKFNTMSSFMDHLKKINVDPLSEQGLKLLSENKKAVATFDENK